MRKVLWSWVVLVMLLVSVAPGAVQGQGRPQTAILFRDPQPGEESLTLNVLFTVLDSTGQALPKDKVQPEGGGQAFGPTIAGVEATVTEATTPIKIALVIDASGSMAEEMADTRQAAINFVRKTPVNAEIAVFKFSDKVEQVQGFTKKEQLGLVENAILTITNRQPGTGNTCIFEAAFAGVNAASSGINLNTALRPAVVLFTDGIDSEAGPCGEIKEPQVVTQARESGVIPTQVHTIGLCGATCANVNTDALRSLAEKTNAATFTGKLSELDSLFDKILATLNQQWMATAIVKPKQGENTISFVFKARVNELPADISLNLNFPSPKDYGAPPAKIEIADRSYDVDKNEYTLRLAVTNPAQVKQLSVALRDASNNTVLTEELATISESMTIPLLAGQLKAGSDFSIEVKAVDVNGQAVTNAKGEVPVDRGKHEPAVQQPISFQFAQPPELNTERNGFVIKLNQVQRAKDVELLYNVSVTQNNRPVLSELAKGVLTGSEIVVMLPPAEVELIRKAEQPAEYAFKVTLTDQVNNQSLTRDQPTTVVPPPRLSWLQRAAAGLRSNPILTAGIMLIVFLVAAIPFLASLRKRKPALAQPLYTGKTVMPEAPIKRPPAEKKLQAVQTPKPPQPVQPVQRPVVGNLTEIGESPAPPSLQINVVATLDPSSNQGEEVTRFPCVIGRENSAFIIAGDPKISRQHTEIVLQGNKLIIKDLKSSNGTFFVVRGPANTGGGFVEKLRLEKGGSAEWDTSSLLRLGPNTVLELKPQGALSAGGSHTVMHDDYANRTQIG